MIKNDLPLALFLMLGSFTQRIPLGNIFKHYKGKFIVWAILFSTLICAQDLHSFRSAIENDS